MKPIKINVFISNIIVFLALLSLWLVVDYVDVKFGSIPDTQYDFIITVGVAWVSFSLTNWRLFKLERKLKVFVISSLSMVLTGIWFFVGVIVVLKFHLFIAGSL
jgi:hypothetical protein